MPKSEIYSSQVVFDLQDRRMLRLMGIKEYIYRSRLQGHGNKEKQQNHDLKDTGSIFGTNQRKCSRVARAAKALRPRIQTRVKKQQQRSFASHLQGQIEKY
jgi:hypothetical protein